MCHAQDSCKAARLLAEHGLVSAAVERLMRPLHQAAAQGQAPNPTWADTTTLTLLYTFCGSLNTPWALQQVAISSLVQSNLVALA